MMSATRYLRFGLLVLWLSVTAYAGSHLNTQLSGAVDGQDGLVSNGPPQQGSSSITSLISPTAVLPTGESNFPGNKQDGKGLSGGGDSKSMGPPLPPVLTPIPEPDVLLDLGMGLATFATLWTFRPRRSA